MSFSNRSPFAHRRRWNLLAVASLGAAAIFAVTAAPAAAQADAAQKTYQFDLPSQSLSRSLAQLSQITGLQLIYTVSESDKATAPALDGRMTADQALARLISGSGFSYRYLRPGVITLERASAVGNDGEAVAGVVQVEGLQGSPYFGGAGQAAGVNGVNGSRDITATEGTGSFTSGALTIGSKVPQALKDVPQSISVLTTERMEQQNVTDFTTAMKQLPGVTLVQGGTNLQNVFYSRGFEITSIQVDGGAPLTTAFNATSGVAYFPQIDMAQYDHVELLRGAAGLFNGYGDPSGTVNLVRKKPLDHSQFLAEAQIGSWSNHRIMVDATSPLALDGKLRGRLVMSYQDNEYFYDIASDNKISLYGIAEIDLTPTTLLSGGISYSRQDSVPWFNGLPRYQTGEDLELPRSTALAFPWNRWDFDTTEFFGKIEQKIGSEWTALLNVTHNRQSSTQKVGYTAIAVNPLNGSGPELRGGYSDFRSEQFSIDASLSGAFEVLGQRQEIVVGVNRVNSDGGGRVIYSQMLGGFADPYQPYPGGPVFCADYGFGGCPSGSIHAAGPTIDVFDFDPYDRLYTELANPLPTTRYPVYGQIQTGAYVNLRLTAFDRLHLTTGLRWSKYQSKYTSEKLCAFIPTTGTPDDTNCVGREIGDAYDPYDFYYNDTDISWPPAISLSYDLTNQLTVYFGYTDIYEIQATLLKEDEKPIDPVTGSNLEAGIKWVARDGRLNASISAFKIKKQGYASPDGEYDFNVTDEEIAQGIYYYFVSSGGKRFANGMVDASHFCCFSADPNRTIQSEGIDVEFAGEVNRGWQISAGYTYNKNKIVGSYYGPQQGLPFNSILPKHLYKLWTSYDFGAAGKSGWLSGLTLSAGINGQSSGYRSGSVCVNLAPPDPITGVSNCVSYQEPDTVPFAFTVPSYAVVSGLIDYRFASNWSLSVYLENIFDKTYYQAAGDVSQGNWYGTPRSFTATLRAKW